MASLDFIIDDEFRKSLTIDLGELDKALECLSLKSAHVLAGSIIEAVLIDFLISDNHVIREDALRLDLAGAIDKCKSLRIISGKTADLCSVVRAYRNLIHPGRAVRLKESIDRNTASVAKSVVTIVLDEIAEIRRKTYGLTATQIVAKIERDSGAVAIIEHLLKDMKPLEIERLLLDVLPREYFSWVGLQERGELPYSGFLKALSICFRKALRESPIPLKARVANRFAELIRTESAGHIELYGNAFFLAIDLEHAAPNNVSMIKDHLLDRLKSNTKNAMPMLWGIGSVLNAKDVGRYVDPFIRAVQAENVLLVQAESFLRVEADRTPGDFWQDVKNHCDDLKRMFKSRGQDDLAEIATAVSVATTGIPF